MRASQVFGLTTALEFTQALVLSQHSAGHGTEIEFDCVASVLFSSISDTMDETLPLYVSSFCSFVDACSISPPSLPSCCSRSRTRRFARASASWTDTQPRGRSVLRQECRRKRHCRRWTSGSASTPSTHRCSSARTAAAPAAPCDRRTRGGSGTPATMCGPCSHTNERVNRP